MRQLLSSVTLNLILFLLQLEEAYKPPTFSTHDVRNISPVSLQITARSKQNTNVANCHNMVSNPGSCFVVDVLCKPVGNASGSF